MNHIRTVSCASKAQAICFKAYLNKVLPWGFIATMECVKDIWEVKLDSFGNRMLDEVEMKYHLNKFFR